MKTVLLLVLAIAGSGLGLATPTGTPHVVGGLGFEPLVREASDGTLFISATPGLYISHDGGGTWLFSYPGEMGLLPISFPSDSSLEVDSSGRIWIAYTPGAETLKVCMSTTHLVNSQQWICNPLARPSISVDRPWIKPLSDGNTFVIASGLTAVSIASGMPVYAPTPIPPQAQYSGFYGDFAEGWGSTMQDGILVAPTIEDPWSFSVFHSNGARETYSTPFHTNSIPSLARDGTGTVYGTDDNGAGIAMARLDSAFGNNVWSRHLVVSDAQTKFAAIGAGSAGHVAILYYAAPANDSVWYAYAAVSANANSPTPAWTIRQVSAGIIHMGAICSSSACVGSERFAGDFLSVSFGPDDVPNFAWVEDYGRNSPTIMFEHG